MQQGGRKAVERCVFLRFADVEVEVGRGCVRREFSNTILKGLQMEGQISPQLADKFRDMYIIEEAATTVTVAHKHGRRRNNFKHFLNSRINANKRK
jgi:hypothetical protein